MKRTTVTLPHELVNELVEAGPRRRRIPLRDCFVAIMAQSHGTLLYTTNKKLRRVGKAMDLGLEFFPERRTLE